MKRSVIQLSTNTKAICLPAEYTKRWNINKGDQLFLTIQGNNLQISTEHTLVSSEITITATECTRSYLEQLYTLGFDTVKVSDGNINYQDIPECFELTSTNPAELRVCIQLEKQEIPYMIRRIQYIVHQIPNPNRLLRTHIRRCLRMIAKYGYKDTATTLLFVSQLLMVQEAIGTTQLRERVSHLYLLIQSI